MKPLPEGLIQHAPGTVEERPWWRQYGPVAGRGFVRRGGYEIIRVDGPAEVAFAQAVHAGRRMGGLPGHDTDRPAPVYITPETDVLDVMAHIDAEHPIPRPPWRAGQVWASSLGGDTRLILRTEDGYVTPAFGLGARTTWRFDNPEILTALPFLLYDPLFPSDAPWSAP